MLKSFKHFKGITKDVTRLSFPEQIVMVDQKVMTLVEKVVFKVLEIIVILNIITSFRKKKSVIIFITCFSLMY